MKRVSKVEVVDKQGEKQVLDFIAVRKIGDVSYVLFDADYLKDTLYNDEETSEDDKEQEKDTSKKVYVMAFDDTVNNSQLRSLAKNEVKLIERVIAENNDREKLEATWAKMQFSIDVEPNLLELAYDIDVSEFMLNIYIENIKEDQGEIDRLIRKIDEKIADLEYEEYQKLKNKYLEDKDKNIIFDMVKILYSVNIYKVWMLDEIRELKQNRDMDIDNNILLMLETLNLLVKFYLDMDYDRELLIKKIQALFETNNDDKIIRGVLSKLVEKKDVLYIVPIITSNAEKYEEYLEELEKIAEILYESDDYSNAIEMYFLIERFMSQADKRGLSELYNSLGCCYIELKKFDEAEKALEEAIRINKKNAAAYNNLAYTYSEYANILDRESSLWKIKMQSAITNIQVAMAIREDVTYYNNHMHIEYDCGNYENVLNIWNQVRENNYKYDEIEGMYYIYVLANLELFEATRAKQYIDNAIEKLRIMYINKPSGLGMYRYVFDSIEQQELAEEKIALVIRIAFLTSKIKENLEVSNKVEQVAYYTSLENFQYILNDEEEKIKYRIPIFDANHMNDPNEGRLLYNFLETHVENFEGFNARKQFSNRVTYNEEFVFLKSFTLNVDSLPMWVHYGKEGKGCCVVVNSNTFFSSSAKKNKDEKAFETKTPQDDYSLYKVVYFDGKTIDKEKYPKLQPLLDSLLQALNLLFKGATGWKDDAFKQITSILDYYLSRIKYFFKHNDYAYEKEVRVILHRNREEALEDIRATKMSFPKIYVYLKNQIKIDEIIFGPKVNEINDYIPFISLKLQKMDNIECIISKSAIDFR